MPGDERAAGNQIAGDEARRTAFRRFNGDRAIGRAGSMTLLHGTELNIAPDGSVDWDAGFLAGFDLCVASVHSHFDQDRAAMTAPRSAAQ